MGIFQFYPQDLKSHVSMTRLESSLFGLGEFWFTNSWPVTSTRRSWLCVWAPGRHLTWGTWNTSRSPSVCTHVSLPRQSSIEQGLSWTFWSSRGCGGQRWSVGGKHKPLQWVPRESSTHICEANVMKSLSWAIWSPFHPKLANPFIHYVSLLKSYLVPTGCYLYFWRRDFITSESFSACQIVLVIG